MAGSYATPVRYRQPPPRALLALEDKHEIICSEGPGHAPVSMAGLEGRKLDKALATRRIAPQSLREAPSGFVKPATRKV